MADPVVANTVGTLASVVTIGQVTRQVRDVYRTARPLGVSAVTWEFALVQSVGLLLLSFAHGYVVAIGVNVIVAFGAAAVLLRVVTDPTGRPRPARGAALTLTTVCCLSLIAAAGGPSYAGDTGAAAAAVVWVPQAVRAARVRSSAGLSWLFVAAGLVSSVLWIGYAVLVGEWRFVIPPASAIIALSVTAGYALRHRREQP